MKVIIYGVGKTGTELVNTFHEYCHDVVVIDNNKAGIESIQRRMDALCILGTIGDDSVIKSAKISGSDVFIAVTDSDEQNIVACIIAKRYNVKKTIARLRNPAYLNKEILNPNELGIDHVINPESEVANEIFRLIRVPWAFRVDAFLKDALSVLELGVTPENKDSINQKLRLLSKTNPVIVMSKKSSTGTFKLFAGNETASPDDRIWLLEKTSSIHRINSFFEEEVSRISSIIVVGGGQTATELLALLEKTPIRVKLIESSKETCNALSQRFSNNMILCGDATDLELLTQEKVEKSDCIVAVTGDDENNIMISLFAKDRGIRKAITKVSKAYGTEILGRLGLHAIVNAYRVTVNKILHFSNLKETVSISSMADNVLIVEFVVPDGARITKRPVKPDFIKGAIIAAVHTRGKVVFPKRPVLIDANSRVVMFINSKYVKDAEAYFR